VGHSPRSDAAAGRFTAHGEPAGSWVATSSGAAACAGAANVAGFATSAAVDAAAVQAAPATDAAAVQAPAATDAATPRPGGDEPPGPMLGA
jgi:hypothetical protein